jgi:hypothetical protein
MLTLTLTLNGSDSLKAKGDPGQLKDVSGYG